MSVSLQMASRTLQKKRLDLEDPADVEGPKLKRPRLAQLPSPSLTPCLQAPIESPVVEAKNQSICSIGPYVLLEATEGAQCYWAVHRSSEEQYTCKVFPMKRYQELFAPYARLPPHEHIGRIEEIITGEQKVYMVFPKSHGDMHSHVRLSKRLPEAEAAPLFRQMAAAVAHCHSHGVILRDLKLRKFVFADKQRNKLVLENLEDSCVLRGEDDLLTDKHGCPAYVGPEILNSKHSYSGRAADIWSLGVVLYTMLVGRYPFQDAEPAALFSKIRRGTYSIPESLSPKAKCLIRCLLRKNPAERLSASEILLHPWLNSSNMATISPSTGPVDSVSLEQVVPDFEKYKDVDFL
ncbi:tribbles homolog 3 [Erpetoichthys calabaricus]|uniref:Tribbles pseudokinase 3 n=1 Tax=Erpetoichthys calabaricus TaxID=27687 RepID=A0A8C4SBN9_ERPCA|nr:tribbles homolog 3 [Erpetoichthys calabaricus]